MTKLYRRCYECGYKKILKRKSTKGLKMYTKCPKCHGAHTFFGMTVETFQLRGTK